ncbi:unnamed protein product [Sympodiomycopsis kandeliae]
MAPNYFSPPGSPPSSSRLPHRSFDIGHITDSNQKGSSTNGRSYTNRDGYTTSLDDPVHNSRGSNKHPEGDSYSNDSRAHAFAGHDDSEASASNAEHDREEQVARSRPTMSISSILNDNKSFTPPFPPSSEAANTSPKEGQDSLGDTKKPRVPSPTGDLSASESEHFPLSNANGSSENGSSSKLQPAIQARKKAAASSSSSQVGDRSSMSIADLLGGPSKEQQPGPSRQITPKKGRGGRAKGAGRGGNAASSNGKKTGPSSTAAASQSETEESIPLSHDEAQAKNSKPFTFEEPSEENSSLWQSELEAYKVRTQHRARAVEDALESQWTDQYLAVHKRIEKGYEVRLSAIVRKSEQRALTQKRQEEDALRLKQEAERRTKAKELDDELLSTLADDSAIGTGKSKGKGKGKASAVATASAGAGKAKGPGKGKGKGKSKSAYATDPILPSPAPIPAGEDGEEDEIDDDASIIADAGPAASTPTKKGKGKKRKLDDIQQQTMSGTGASTPGGDTPVKQEHEDSTPTPQAQHTDGSAPLMEAEIDPDGPPLPMDEKRVRQLEDAHRRLWVVMARKEIPKVYRVVQATVSARGTFTKRVAAVVQREARRGQARMGKQSKDVQQKARKAMREMLVFWRKNEKEEKELRRKADKEAADRLRKEEELRETKRQARKLNFLITQTELYSHFVGNKLRTNEAEESEETSGGSSKLIDPSAANTDAPASVPPMQAQSTNLDGSEGTDPAALKDIDFDDEDESNMRAHAARNAREAVAAAKDKAQAFDARAAEDRRKAEEAAAAADREGRTIAEKDLGKAFDSDDMNFQNPTSMGQMDVSQPKMLTCQLKEYQLKGLNWLANLYEQGINGILADEMGLGKTVQSISLMSYLAEVHDIWGPFLVIAPSSTLHNWQQEITKFTPALKALPYWGNVKDRDVLRKFWNKKHMQYNRDSPFHVLITSYQLVVTDEKYFKRLKWQYMILDEAQAIKSSQSTRWKTLLSFNCRNRLLLTGTPVQNSMQELWALLHFIMPSLFDSHDEFSEWFSKDIEGHAENKGTLNEGQLRRLHMILKPFMLRRVKKNVQNELGDKIEIDVMCEMSARQKMLYRGLRENVSIAELMDRASNLQDEAGLKHLMNLVMQFRKVCNHPELFERADVTAPLNFGSFAQTASLSRQGDLLYCPDSAQNAIEYQLPKTIVREGGLLNVAGPRTRAGFETRYLDNLMNIWREDYVHDSLQNTGSAFAPLRLLNLNGRDAELGFHGHSAAKTIGALDREQRLKNLEPYLDDDEFAASSVRPLGRVAPSKVPHNLARIPQLASLDQVAQDYAEYSPLADPSSRVWTSKAVAPAIKAYSSDKPFLDDQERVHRDQLVSNMLYGIPDPGCEDEHLVNALQRPLPGLPPRGILHNSGRDQLPAAQMQVPQINKLIIDSSKLAHLDRLLRELKANDHRVLIYFQMTKMIDLMEEYLIYRQYKYLRLDGSSKISERRDMVTDWQTKPELFVFLLSTRAGGLGINLTAADTVIFFDSDWNPSNDQQAMDRAHRLGQTKQVTVYRLITRGTIDERIIKMARNKKEVQDMVVGNKTYNEAGMAKPQEIVSLLMDDDELADAMLKKRQAEEAALRRGQLDNLQLAQKKKKLKAAAAAERSQQGTPTPGGRLSSSNVNGGANWTLEDDEDDFFGAKPSAAPKIEEIEPNGSNSKKGSSKKGSGSNSNGTVTPNKKKTAANGTSTSKKRSAAALSPGDESMSGSVTTVAASSKKKKTATGEGSNKKSKIEPAEEKADQTDGVEGGSTFADLENSMLDE